MAPVQPRILFIDAFDSFSNNIIALIQSSIGAEVDVVKINDSRFDRHNPRSFVAFLQSFDAVVAGPGPGNPTNPDDVGIFNLLWSLESRDVLPVFGICLGFQSLCLAFGAEIETLRTPRHGIQHLVIRDERDIFKEICDFEATSYHSLHVNIGHRYQTSYRKDYDNTYLWDRTEQCPDLQPLAWDTTDVDNTTLLMAARHITKPFWGVQYHPESICTNQEGKKVIRGWWNEACKWSKAHPRNVLRVPINSSLKTQSSDDKLESWAIASSHIDHLKLTGALNISKAVRWSRVAVEKIDVMKLCKVLHIPAGETIVLHSGLKPNNRPINKETGRFSIICIFQPRPPVIRIQYFVKSKMLNVDARGTSSSRHSDDALQLTTQCPSIWEYLKQFMRLIACYGGSDVVPFWGGLAGYTSYEAGLETINVKCKTMQDFATKDCSKPDLNYALIQRSIVIDHETGYAYIQSILPHDEEWIKSTRAVVHRFANDDNEWYDESAWCPTLPTRLFQIPDAGDFGNCKKSKTHDFTKSSHASKEAALLGYYISQKLPIKPPGQIQYLSKIYVCEDAIRSGQSYELCLTDQTKIAMPSSQLNTGVGWMLFQKLTKSSPAPFSAYYRLGKPGHGVTIVGSSPERFLSWDRKGKCQLRPIKGTVRKSPDVTREDAERILNSSKEQAENLMITDLIRHDLHGALGTGKVEVTKLMVIEEYSTLYQLVSVIEGSFEGNRKKTSRSVNTGGRLEIRPQSYPEIELHERRMLQQATNSLFNKARYSKIRRRLSDTSFGIGNQTTFNESALLSIFKHPARKFCPEPLLFRKLRKDLTLHKDSPCGIDVLSASLPPGSMTGAPKKRSCELLQDIERGQPRGIYSGLLGYLDVGGGGDFSVVIRTAYHWDSDFIEQVPRQQQAALVNGQVGVDALPGNQEYCGKTANGPPLGCDLPIPEENCYDIWTLGAGGAITAQSGALAEYDEMLTKLNSVLLAFDMQAQAEDPSKWTLAEKQEYLDTQRQISELNRRYPGRLRSGQPQISLVTGSVDGLEDLFLE